MDFSDLIKKRRSTRQYQNKPIDQQSLEKILEACNLAPSAGNLQSYKIFVVQDSETKKQIAKAALEQNWIAQASMVLVFFANPEESATKYASRGAKLYSIQDATIAAAYSQLKAVDLGLDTAWIGAFEDEKINKICSAEKNLVPVAIIPIGYGDPTYEKRTFNRKGVKNLAKFIRKNK